MQTEYERIDIRQVLVKDEIKWQIISSDGKKDLTKNVAADFDFTQLFESGYANLLVDTQDESYQVRISKKDEALVAISKVKLTRDLSHDRQKVRMLPESNQVFKALDLSDLLGRIKPSKMDKYKQVDEFLRLISQTLDTDLSNQDEISVVDLGCGHAYLTFAVQEFSGITAEHQYSPGALRLPQSPVLRVVSVKDSNTLVDLPYTIRVIDPNVYLTKDQEAYILLNSGENVS